MDTSLQQRIQSADLTRTEKRIADYFLDHSESLYFMTARDIAQELGVSDTSIIRLCRTLGYRGFRELQESQPPVIWGCCCPSTSTASPTIAMRTPAAWRASLTTALRTA